MSLNYYSGLVHMKSTLRHDLDYYLHLGDCTVIKMRLLRQKSNVDFELGTFNTDKLPPYAILSHTWTDGEEILREGQFLLGFTRKSHTGRWPVSAVTRFF